MTGFRTLTLTVFRLYLREPIGTFFIVVFPVFLVLLFGAMFGNEPTEMFGGYGSMDISMPGYTALILATASLMGLPITTCSYRETGVLRRLRVTPLKSSTYITADLLSNLALVILGMIGVLALGNLIYHVRFEGLLWAVALGVLLCFLAMASLGYLIASFAPNARAAQIIGMSILYPMLYLAGAGMPVEVLPESLRKVSAFLPPTYIVRLLRGLWFGDQLEKLWLPLLVVVLMLLVCGSLAAKFFKWE
jgi:ABC-2 type transport system permease protein